MLCYLLHTYSPSAQIFQTRVPFVKRWSNSVLSRRIISISSEKWSSCWRLKRKRRTKGICKRNRRSSQGASFERIRENVAYHSDGILNPLGSCFVTRKLLDQESRHVRCTSLCTNPVCCPRGVESVCQWKSISYDIDALNGPAFQWKFVAFSIQPRDIHYPTRSLKPGQRGGDLIDSYWMDSDN